MLVIRQNQFDTLRTANEEKTKKQIEIYLRKNNAEAVEKKSPEELDEIINEGIKKSKDYGLKYMSSLCWFIVMMLEVSLNFDQQDQIQIHLSNKSIPPEIRIQVILEKTDDDDWDEARQL
jgi:uncharacterized protein YehS (DUF1456 family)